MPKSDLDKMQEWVIRYSKQVGYNLSPVFEFWRWPITDETKEELSHLDPYFPDDSITQSK